MSCRLVGAGVKDRARDCLSFSWVNMGGAASTAAETEVWPPDWESMDEGRRRVAREHIMGFSSVAPAEFLVIADQPHCIPPQQWKFEEYHAAAAAAVQEDIKLNKLTYKLVPKKLEESEFWRLYFSQVLHILDSVKLHGTYPPPPPPPPRQPAPPPAVADADFAHPPREPGKPRFPQPGTRLLDECNLM